MARLDLLITAAPAAVQGNGLPGSVFHITRGMIAFANGDLVRAREEISAADQSLLLTVRFLGALDIHTGDADRALRYALSIRPETKMLRQLEIWRTSFEVTALLALSDRDNAKLILTVLLKEMIGLNEEERRLFSQEVYDFALQCGIQWPEMPGQDKNFAIAPSFPSVIISAREREVLSQVVLGRSRSEAAQNLFLSENTVKTHLSALYKKMGVVNRTQLIAEARLRSIV